MSTYRELPPAPTLRELRARLDDAIALAGDDATWNGWDDEVIYIYPRVGQWLCG